MYIEKNNKVGYMSKPNDSAKRKALDLAISYIEKQFGEGSVMSLGNHRASHAIQTISTGAISLDLALGVGGVPRGRIVEIYGPESSGKSTLATHIVANCQKMGGIAAYIDTEHAFDPLYSERIGVNLKDLMFSQPNSGEEALSITEIMARSNAIDVIVIDSVAALIPKSELEGEIGDSHIGLQARLMSQALRKFTSTLAKSNTCVIFINQIREKVGVLFGNPEVTPGGRALKFYASIRMEIRRVSTIKGPNNTEIGTKVKVKVVKNKMGPPFRNAEFEILFNEGISRTGVLIDLGVENGIIEKKGTWYSFGEKKFGQGKEAAREELKNDKELADKIESLITEKLQIKTQEPALT